MKKCLLLLLTITCIGLASCEYNEFTELENTTSKQAYPRTWQEQIEYGKNKTAATRSINSSEMPILMQETYLGKIQSQADIDNVLKEIFADDAVTVLYNEDYSEFNLFSVGEIKQAIKELGVNDYFEEIRSRLIARIELGMELIKLEWLYKDEVYQTIAIASNDQGGIIFDAIGSAIVEITPNPKTKQMMSNTIPVLRSEDESGSTSSQNFRKSESGHSGIWGTLLWQFYINVTSEFNSSNKLHSKTMSAEGNSFDSLWSCKAEVSTITGNIDISTYHEFAWGYVCGKGSVSLTFNGAGGFSVSGGSSSGNGIETHRP